MAVLFSAIRVALKRATIAAFNHTFVVGPVMILVRVPAAADDIRRVVWQISNFHTRSYCSQYHFAPFRRPLVSRSRSTCLSISSIKTSVAVILLRVAACRLDTSNLM